MQIELNNLKHDDAGKELRCLNRFHEAFIGSRNALLEAAVETQEHVHFVVGTKPKIDAQVSFTSKQARNEIQETVHTHTRDTSQITNGVKKVLYTRHKLINNQISQVRVDLYLKTIGSFVKLSQIISSQFAVFRFNSSREVENFIRLIYYYQNENGEWIAYGYITESLNQIEKEELGDGVIEKQIRSAKEAVHIGSVILTIEEEINSPFTAIMKFGLKDATKYKGGRYLRIERLIKGMGMVSVFTTPIPEENEEWHDIKMPLRKLCNGDVDLEINLVVEELNQQTKKMEMIGFHVTTFARCERNQGSTFLLASDGEISPDGPKIVIKKCNLKRFFGSQSIPVPKSKETKIESLNDLKLRTLIKSRPSLKASLHKNVSHKFAHQLSHSSSIQRRQDLNSIFRVIYDIRLWLESEPFRRAARKLPVTRSVVSISLAFGSGISAFFQFYASVLLLNLALSILWMAVIVIPYGIDMKSSSSFIDTIYAFTGFRNLNESSTALWAFYGDYSSSTQNLDFRFLNHSVLYNTRDSGPGMYPDDYFEGKIQPGTPYAWCIVGTVLISLFFILVDNSSAYDSVERMTSNTDIGVTDLSAHCFGAWDHMCGSAKYNLVQILGYNQQIKTLQRAKEIQLLKMAAKSLSFKQKMLLFLRRGFFISISVLFAFAAVSAIVAITVEQDKLSKTFSFIPAILLASINAVIPFIVSFCVRCEKWEDSAFEDRNIIGREFVLKVTNIFTIYYHTSLKISRDLMDSEGFECIQDMLGQTFLRLFLTELISDSLSSIISPLFTKWIRRKKHHFTINRRVLSLLYRQLIIWTATPYCPILPLVGLIGSYFEFVWKAYCLLRFSSPSPRPWSVGKARVFFIQMMLLTLFIGVVTEIYFLYSNFNPVDVESLKYACGPHIDWTGTHGRGRVFSYLLSWNDVPFAVQKLLEILFHPIFLLFCLFVTTSVIVWLFKFSSTIGRELKSVSASLIDEHHDKMLLLQRLEEEGRLETK